jgi:hypothetical protein
MTVRDRLWLWGHEAGAHNGHWELPAASHVTPGQAAASLGIPNVIMVRYGEAFDADAAVRDLSRVSRVVWSVVGAAGFTDGSEVGFVREQAAHDPRWVGVMMDDFFLRPHPGDDRLAVHTVADLRAMREALVVAGRRLDLWVVLYDNQLDLPLGPHLEQCDVISYWTWRAEDLAALEPNFERLEALAPRQRKVLGCYMWDYGTSRPMPLPAFQRQCEQGLAWLKEGRIDGLIFLASCICDLDIDTVRWARDWIDREGSGGIS